MSRKRNPQETPAVALAQLIQEFPELPLATWTIDPVLPRLRGHLHNAGFEELGAWAAVLGGEIAPEGRDWEFDGRLVRTHKLSATWRDAEVEVVVVVPVGAAVASGGQVAA